MDLTLARRRAFHKSAGSIGLMDARSIHHVGVAVADLDEAVAVYTKLFGAELEHRATVTDQGVEAATMRIGDGRVELLASLGPDTPVGKFLAKRGPGMHHLAFEVGDVDGELRRLAAAGTELVDERSRQGLFGLEVGFLHPEATGGVLVELVSRG
jgi:methylmalonyl-CoA epimerase